MIVEDFVCLGRTVPEESKKYGHKVCMAGYSQELGQLLRVYPLPVKNALRLRHCYTLGLCRNNCDSRRESWKMTDRIASYESSDLIPKQSLRDVFDSIKSESIDELNASRASLGVLLCDEVRGKFKNRTSCGPTQMELFETCDRTFGAGAIKVAPYLNFTVGGKSHCLQMREWGCYEWIRKHPARFADLWSNLRIDEPRSHYLLVGNMANRRNVWLVINIFGFQKQEQPTLAF